MITPVSRRIGAYEIVSKLGRGGMADVYLAQHDSGQRVALKLIEHSPDQDTNDAIEAERRGAKLQAQLADIDPRVVRVYDSADADGFFYVAMEYIAGQDLAELMRGGPLAVGFACDAALAVGETLGHAHNLEASVDGKDFRGIVHGDIKPKNIRIDTRGDVRVLDFGIAKALSLSRRLTRNEFGSVPYASPERLDSGDVNAQSDLWSLAVTLYEMVTGMQPYQAENTERLERMIRSRIPPPPAPDPCPQGLRVILQRALATDPAYRFPSAHDFTAAIAGFRGIALPLPALQYEPDATRRTIRPGAGADEETRRTTKPLEEDQGETRRTLRTDGKTPGSAVAANLAPAGKAKVRPFYFPWAVRTGVALAAGLFVYTAWSAVDWVKLHGKGEALERQIKAEQVTDPDEIWTKWKEVVGKNDPGSWALGGARGAVEMKLLDSANTIIARYHNDTQVVHEKDWDAAQTELANVLTIDPDNETARGELRFCEGEIARINGFAHKSTAELNQAIEKFNEAAKLLPKSPDPYLGLAQVYVSGLSDLDKGSAAFDEAQKRGYTLGKRENAQLADGYARRADRLFKDADNVRGLPQEKDQVARAASDYQKALSLYQQIMPYGKSTDQVTRLQHVLDIVQARLDMLQSSGAPANVGGQDHTASKGGGLAGAIIQRVLQVAGERLAGKADVNSKPDPSPPPPANSQSGLSGPVYSVGNGVSEPVAVYRPEPEYTEIARLAKIQGDVVLSVEVDATGHVGRVQVLQGLGYGLDLKATQAVSTWRFRPALLNGSAVAVRIPIRVSFHLS